MRGRILSWFDWMGKRVTGKLAIPVTCLVLLLSCFLQVSTVAQNSWDGDNAVGNFDYNNNWFGDSYPATWNSSTNLEFAYRNNGSQTSIYQNRGWLDIRSLIYLSTFAAAIPLDGDGSSGFNFWWKIENSSSNDQIINVPLSAKGTGIELIPNNGKLTINTPIYNDLNKPFIVYGPNSKELHLNGQLYGDGTVTLTIAQYSKVSIGYNNGTGSFGGGVDIQQGELWFQPGGTINGGNITVGSNGNTAKVYQYATTGGSTLTNSLTTTVGSTPTIGGLNSSGTHIFSGSITLNQSATFECYSGGTVEYSGAISGTGGITTARISGSGQAIIRLNGSGKTYSGSTTVGNGTTLNLNVTNAIPAANAITVQSGGILQISQDQTLANLTIQSGGTLLIDAGKSLTLSGSFSCNGTIQNDGTIILTGPSAFPGSGATVASMYHLTINRGAGVTLDKDLTVTSVLELQSGVLYNTAPHQLAVSNTASNAITGGSSSYIDGPVTWNLPASLAAGSTYTVPLGDNGIYYPLALVDPVTGAGTITFTAQAFNAATGGTAGATLSSLSTTEYWSVASSGNLTNYKVNLTRQSALGVLNRAGRCTTLNGAYQSAGGTPSGTSIINSFNTGAGAQQFFVMAKAGPVTVSGANASSNGDYGTLQAAFIAINLYSQTGNNISVMINGSTTESGQAQLNQNSNAWSTLVVYPTVTGCTVTGSLAGTSLVLLNGADNVTFDGRVNLAGTTPDLTLSNTSTSSNPNTSTLHLSNDATTNTFAYCNILGSSTTTPGTNGGTVWVGAVATVTGNDNNTFSRCNLGPAGVNLPTKGFYMQGTGTGKENSAVVVTDCNIYDFFSPTGESAGIYCENFNTDCSFTNNRLYQTATRTQTAGNRHMGIAIANTSGNNFVISGNTIGYSSAAGTGTYTIDGVAGTRFLPVYLNVGTTGTTTVLNNTITAIAMTGSCTGSSAQAPFSAIDIEGGLVTTSNNVIGSLSATGSITYTTTAVAPNSSHLVGIYNRGSSAWTSTGNTIGGITGSCSASGYVEIFGLRGNGTGTPAWTCTNNTVGGTVANSIRNTSGAGGSQLFGIYNTSYTGSFSGNTVQNLVSAGGTATTVPVTGIHLASTVGQTVTGNTIHDLSNSNPTDGTAVDGIRMASGGSSSLTGNFIYGLTNNTTTSTSAEINGIALESGTVNCTNNIVSISAATAGAMVHGIKDNGAANSLWHNTVSLTGSTTSGTMDACYRSVSSTTRDVRSNIFANSRTGSGTRYAYNITDATGLSMSYNDNIGTTLGVPAGLNSLATQPTFPAAGAGTLLTDYIPGVTSLVGDASLLGSVTTDIDGTARCNPTMGAQETASQAPPTPGPITGQTGYCVGQIGLVYSITAVAGATSYTWSLPAGWSITAGAGTTSITVSTAGSGPGIISVTATNSCGLTSPARTLGVNSGVIEVDGTTPPTTGCYPTLHEAFDAINLGVHMGVITVKVNGSTTETETALLNANGTGSAVYSQVTMYPTGAGYQIYGSIDAPLITLWGATNVTIDGRVNQAGAVDLALVNASTTTTLATTIYFINDASNNQVKYCTIKGSGPTSFKGILTFGDATSTGNNDNIIANNDITSNGSNRPFFAVYSGDASGIGNARNTIQGNNIYNFLNGKDIVNSAGIYLTSGMMGVTGTTAWEISGNNFYDTSPGISPAKDASFAMVYIENGGSDYLISNNSLGGSGPGCSGTLVKTGSSNNLFYGIYFDGISATISSNTIRSFDWTNNDNASWSGIYIYSGAVTVGGSDASKGNIIGSDVGTASIKITAGNNSAAVHGIYRWTSFDDVVIRYNKIGSIETNNSNSANSTTLYGILNFNGNTDIISDNLIGSTTQAGSLHAASPATGATSIQRLIGIFNDGGIVTFSGNTISNLLNDASSIDNGNTSRVNGISCSDTRVTITGNTVSNLSMAGGIRTASDASVVGINIPSTNLISSTLSLSNNLVYNLSNTHATAATSVTGIYNGSKRAGVIEGNFIHSLSVASSSATAQVTGIGITGIPTGEVVTYQNNIVSLANATANGKIYGIFASNGKTVFYHNSVSLTGSNSGYKSAFTIEDNHVTTAENNLFINAITGGSAADIIIAEPGDNLNYNDYFGSISNIGLNPNSLYNVDPQFPAPAGTTLTDYIPAAVNLIGNTALLPTIPLDIDGTSRCVPTMGAQENRQFPTGVTATALPANPVCTGSTLNLTGTATGALSWSWSGPNGFTSALQNPSINNITTAGTGTYTLTVTNNCGPATATVDVVVTDPVPVSVLVTASANPVCAGTSVTFTATPTNGGTTPVYQWKVNGVNVGINSPTYTYAPANGDLVTCVLQSSDSCVTGNPATSNTVTMTVNPKPPPIIIYHN